MPLPHLCGRDIKNTAAAVCIEFFSERSSITDRPSCSGSVLYCLCVCWQYGIALDAGSSHTSLFVYKWSSHKHKDTGYVKQLLKCPENHTS